MNALILKRLRRETGDYRTKAKLSIRPSRGEGRREKKSGGSLFFFLSFFPSFFLPVPPYLQKP